MQGTLPPRRLLHRARGLAALFFGLAVGATAAAIVVARPRSEPRACPVVVRPPAPHHGRVVVRVIAGEAADGTRVTLADNPDAAPQAQAESCEATPAT